MIDRRLEIVQGLIGRVPEPYQQTVDTAMCTWWYNIRRGGGMRLTKLGYTILHDVLALESWSLDLGDPAGTDSLRPRINKKNILAMDRKLRWPYYLDFDARRKTKRIVFFGSKEAMMATMYGDLEPWLKSLG